MHSLQPVFLQALRFTAEDATTLRNLGRHQGRQELHTHQRPEVLKALLTVAEVESSESSNRIEGVVAPHDRIEAIVLRDTKPRNRSEQEIAGYRDALRLVHGSACRMAFTPGVVKQLHSMMYAYHPAEGGRWKATDNEIVERDASGVVTRVRFRAVPAILVTAAMEELSALHASSVKAGQHDAFTLIPLAILDFLCIHPFTDGNGRIARLLTLMLLYQAGFEVGRYISLERMVEESRDSYYEALEASSVGWHEGTHDPLPWSRYLWGVLLRAHREFEQRVSHIATGRGSKSEQVRSAVLATTLPFSVSELERACPGVSRETVRLVLRAMRGEGVVELTGRGRGARWNVIQG